MLKKRKVISLVLAAFLAVFSLGATSVQNVYADPDSTEETPTTTDKTLKTAEEGECASLLTGMCDGSSGNIMSLIKLVVKILTAGVTVAGTIGVIICGITMLTARDNAAQVEKAKKRIFEIVIGLVLWVLAAVLVGFILPGADTSMLTVINVRVW